MDHLTDEQFEVLIGGEPESCGHLESCDACRTRLNEKQALAARLQQAFGNIKAGEVLVSRIQNAIAASESSSQEPPTALKSRFIVLHQHLFSALAAVAAILVFAIPGVLYLSISSRVEANQMELVGMHQYNLAGGERFKHCSDPNTFKSHFHDHLECNPAEAGIGPNQAIHGCCVHEYKGQQVDTYVVEVSEGLVTVLTLTERPRALGMCRMSELSRPDYVIWGAVCDHCNMAARRVGKKTYYAMGQVSHAALAKILTDS